jgi:hypothetical protein
MQRYALEATGRGLRGIENAHAETRQPEIREE